MLVLMLFVFYFACFVSAQRSIILPPFTNSTSSSISNTFTSSFSSSSSSSSNPTLVTLSNTAAPAPIFSTTSSTLSTSTTSPSSAPTLTPLSCPASNNTLYTAPSGQTFVVECSIDHERGDLSSLSVPNLEACIAACDSNSKCVDVSLSGTACYLKSLLGRSLPAPGLLGARLLGVETPISCPGSNGTTHTTPDGRSFQVECGVDYAGGDMGSLALNSIVGELWLETCIDSCSNMTGCVDISLSGSACYLKRTLGARLIDSNISSARLLSPPADDEEDENDRCNIYSPTCPACNNTVLYSIDSEPEKSFVIECGIDRPGGDMRSEINEHTGLRGPRAFRNCFETCAETEGCVDVSLLGGVCYLKDRLERAVVSEGVWGARVLE
ncbi:uncharacterized protein RCC_05734 [Ramularia collo-cygni]|uniref:Apple domain-containing protein n=1 Tax=Ramularia collo-cygni TaxID=112498 RepID=A0A2D3UWU9_9PEZI|nr:uncharacterized protein RCC_05734 [Ramularia collo-cygni]CZT19878.1 uncharacterized protein RCC_05734 [Ramularia collo-cygni]